MAAPADLLAPLYELGEHLNAVMPHNVLAALLSGGQLPEYPYDIRWHGWRAAGINGGQPVPYGPGWWYGSPSAVSSFWIENVANRGEIELYITPAFQASFEVGLRDLPYHNIIRHEYPTAFGTLPVRIARAPGVIDIKQLHPDPWTRRPRHLGGGGSSARVM